MDQSWHTSRTLIKKSAELIWQNSELYLTYLFLYLVQFGLLLVVELNMAPGYFVWFGLIFLFFAQGYIYTLPILLWKRTNKQTMSVIWLGKTYFGTLTRLFLPLSVALFLLLTCLAVIDLTFNAKLFSTNDISGFGFYPLRAGFNTVFETLATFFLFSPMFFSIKRMGYVKSLKESLLFVSKHSRIVFPIMSANIFLTLLSSLFVPGGNHLVGMGMLLLEVFLDSLVFTAMYLYYDQHYKISASDFLPVKKDMTVHVKVIYRRIGAGLIDMLIWWVVFVAAAVVFDAHMGGFYSLTGIPFITYIACEFAYFVLMEWLWQGTVGKKLVGIRVVTEEGTRATFGKILIRNLLRIIDAFPFVVPYVTGLIIVAASDKKQRLGDKLAKTVVST